MDYGHLRGAAQAGGFIVVIIVMILASGGILSLANRVINGFWAHYGRAIATVVVVGIIDTITHWIIGVHGYWAGLVIGNLVEMLVGGAILNAFVRRPDGSSLGYQRAVLVFLALIALEVLASVGFHFHGQAMLHNVPTQ